MSNSIAPGSSADVNVRVTALTTNPNVPAQYKTIILKKNLVNGVNTLTQEMMSATNIKYVVKYDYVLGEDVTVPANCVLEFDGGSIANANGNDYTIKGHFSITDCHYQIFKNVNFVRFETYLGIDFLRPEWWGAKGDYDVNSDTGTDDSSAIQQTIYNANISFVNKVKFSSLIYLVSNQININVGNIILEGTYANIREENHPVSDNSNIREQMHSSLFTKSAISILNFTTTVARPIQIRHIDFTGVGNTAKAIEFGSINSGPTWPFIIEYCHFQDFNKAIFFKNNGTRYNIHKFEVRYCGFNHNDICIDMADCYSWDLFVHNNCMHHNVRIANLVSSNTKVYFYNNNCEGFYATSKTPKYNYMVNITALYGADVKCYGNHFESNDTNLISINGLAGGQLEYISDIDVYDNSYESISTNIIPITLYGQNMSFRINKLDNTTYLQSGVYLMDKVYENLIIDGTVRILFNDFGNRKPFNPNFEVANTLQKYSDTFIMEKGVLSSGHTVASSQLPGIQSAFVNAAGYICGILDNGNYRNVEGLTIRHWIANDAYDFFYLTKKEYRYSMVLYKNTSITPNAVINTYISQNVFASGDYICQIVTNDLKNVKDIISDSKIPENLTSAISSVTNMKVGDRLFNGTKPIYWNGTAWVDATGTPV